EPASEPDLDRLVPRPRDRQSGLLHDRGDALARHRGLERAGAGTRLPVHLPADRPRARSVGRIPQDEDGPDMSSRWQIAKALAYRQATVLVKNPSLFVPPMLFPLMNFIAFAGGLSRLRQVGGFDFKGGYTAFS